jgi:hypothetical protein
MTLFTFVFLKTTLKYGYDIAEKFDFAVHLRCLPRCNICHFDFQFDGPFKGTLKQTF